MKARAGIYLVAITIAAFVFSGLAARGVFVALTQPIQIVFSDELYPAAATPERVDSQDVPARDGRPRDDAGNSRGDDAPTPEGPESGNGPALGVGESLSSPSTSGAGPREDG